jgi:hypothetical protein
MTSPPRAWGAWLVFALLTAVVTGVLGWWLGERQRLGAVDDAYISLRYAENWATGRGLSFNPGERVEGTRTFCSWPWRRRSSAWVLRVPGPWWGSAGSPWVSWPG